MSAGKTRFLSGFAAHESFCLLRGRRCHQGSCRVVIWWGRVRRPCDALFSSATLDPGAPSLCLLGQRLLLPTPTDSSLKASAANFDWHHCAFISPEQLLCLHPRHFGFSHDHHCGTCWPEKSVDSVIFHSPPGTRMDQALRQVSWTPTQAWNAGFIHLESKSLSQCHRYQCCSSSVLQVGWGHRGGSFRPQEGVLCGSD